MKQRYREFRQGLFAALPITAGYVPVAITFGLVARDAGLVTTDAIAASLIVFAGASQFMGVGMFAAGAGGATIVLATFLLNLRHFLMSSVMASRFVDRRIGTRAALAFGVTDEVFAVATATGERSASFTLGLEIGAYLSWFAGTVIGSAVGSVLPQLLRHAFGVALYGLFAALLSLNVRENVRMILPAVLGAGLNIGMRALGAGAGAAFPVALVGAALLSMVLVPDSEAP